MNTLIIGNMGYVGPAVVRYLKSIDPDGRVIGYDAGYFAHCLTEPDVSPECLVDQQYSGDARDIPDRVFQDVGSCVYLAAISNDPMGESFAKPTLEINHEAAIAAARQSRRLGVKHFVFASSCSIYGFADGQPRKEADALNPLTVYARSKVLSEQGLKEVAGADFLVTCLRFATACGMSSRLRLDLVLNDFVASAMAARKISVLSNGSPWRPLIDVRDMARAIDWAIRRDQRAGGAFLAVNTGRDDWNFQIKDLAQAVAGIIEGTEVSMNHSAPADKRSYKVDFGLFRSLAAGQLSQCSIEETIRGIWDGLKAIDFDRPDFRNLSYMRVNVLKSHVAKGRLTSDLRWVRTAKYAAPTILAKSITH